MSHSHNNYLGRSPFDHGRSAMESLHGRMVKALVNHFGGPGSIPSAGCSEREPGCEIFAPVPDAALNGCKLHVKPDFNF